MNNFTFYSPTQFIFGKGQENHTGEYVKKYGGSKVLIHYGGGSVIRSGLMDRVKASLLAEGLSFVELGGVKPNPRSGLVYEGIALCKQENVDFVLAVGGGSTIDSAKAIALGSVYEGDFWDFYSGKYVEKALPVATVLTIAAAGSEGSPGSVITKEEGLLKLPQPLKALSPNDVRFDDNVISVKLLQLLKALFSIVVTLLGTITLFRLLLSQNAA